MAEYIEREAVERLINKLDCEPEYQHTGETFYTGLMAVDGGIDDIPNADVVEVDKISEALADLFDAPCNFSPIDEWLPCFCDFKYECNCESKECWKQFFKHYSKKECAK